MRLKINEEFTQTIHNEKSDLYRKFRNEFNTLLNISDDSAYISNKELEEEIKKLKKQLEASF